MNTPWNWNGARWWKFDFHTHTPASNDYGKCPGENGEEQKAALQTRTPREWLLDFMREEVDCVAVTDHNSGAWIDKLKQALSELKKEKPEGYRPLVLFPGVELSVSGGVHLLAIFDLAATTGKIDHLLGAVEYDHSKEGTSNTVTEKTVVQVVEMIVKNGGIAIPAHVYDPKGLFKEVKGTTLEQILKCDKIFSMEVVGDKSAKPQLYNEHKVSWTEVLGSDSHHPSGPPGGKYPGSHFTWVKMGTPSLEGLRLALLDGPLSVCRSTKAKNNPNEHADMVVESIEVSKARYMGGTTPFKVELNPWMNAIIGGRGTGKSTLIEFLRLAMRREGEIPETLKSDFDKYFQGFEDHREDELLTPKASIQVCYRKNGVSYRIYWGWDDTPFGLPAIEELTSEGEWKPAEGDIRDRFPVRIYSQKQIYHMASKPLALLRSIDDAREVDFSSWKTRMDDESNRYLTLRAKIREIESKLAEESKLKGELDDIKQKMTVLEKSGHQNILKMLDKRKQQQKAIMDWENGLVDIDRRMNAMLDQLDPGTLDETSFDPALPEDAQLLELARRTSEEMKKAAIQVRACAKKFEKLRSDWIREKSNSSWKTAADKASLDYNTLLTRLKEQGLPDASGYGVLVQQRQATEKRLKELEGSRRMVADLKDQAMGSLESVKVLRREITEIRRNYLDAVLINNPHVKIAVVPYGGKETAEAEIRDILGFQPGTFEKDLGTPDGTEGFLGNLYKKRTEPSSPESTLIETRLKNIKDRIREIAANPTVSKAKDHRFGSSLSKKPPETFDRLDLWFPEDSLEVKYSQEGKGQFRPIQEGSPGQKTAAMLAFLLSHGEEPLILDQPEDDLDNHLIYDLIVNQLREIKQHRQIIVVTHNANIVVNGDAELVVALEARDGQTQTEANGCLQDRKVRQTICNVMEGGRTAFEKRYRRIFVEGADVR